MRVSNAKWLALGWIVGSGCAVSHDVGSENAAASAGGFSLSASCQQEVEDAFDGLPLHFDCTGLYKDTPSKTLADNREQFTPAFPLWSDASVKTRWISLPAGESIDASNPKAWVFPEGTRFWKEFRNVAGDRRIETRIFSKTKNGEWSRATYQWDDDEHNATRVDDGGKDITVDGKPYRLPSRQQCDECHKGRQERVLGFDQVSLGQTGSTEDGLALDGLLARDLLSGFNGPMPMAIGPDPESAEARALGWMHTNCGVSCHNDNSNSKAYSNGMRLVLDPAQLDGRATSDFDSLKTTIDQSVAALQWRTWKRIDPGAPEQSWLYKLITQRGDPKEQMPPLASNEVDTANTELVRQWIVSLGDNDSPTTAP